MISGDFSKTQDSSHSNLPNAASTCDRVLALSAVTTVVAATPDQTFCAVKIPKDASGIQHIAFFGIAFVIGWFRARAREFDRRIMMHRYRRWCSLAACVT